MTKEPRPLWTCPECGAKLLTKNMWHSCGYASMKDWYGRMGPRAHKLFERFERMIAKCGEYHGSPAKTRIAFHGRVRFVGVLGLSEDAMTCAFALPYPLRSRRFAKVEEVVPGWWIHRLRVTAPFQLDAQVQRWLRKSYQLMGMQGRQKTEGRGESRRQVGGRN